MRIDVKMIDSFRIERRSAALDAVDDVTLFQKKLGEVAAVLAGDAGNERGLASSCRTANRDQTRAPLPWRTPQTVLNKFAMPYQTGELARICAVADIRGSRENGLRTSFRG